MPILEEMLRMDYEARPRYPTKPLPQGTRENPPYSLTLFISNQIGVVAAWFLEMYASQSGSKA